MGGPGPSSLFELLYEGKLDALQKELLARPSELHLLDRNGESLLHLAIRRTDVAAVRLLLAAGFDINTRSAGNWTVMEEAVAVTQAAVSLQGQGPAITVLREIHHATQADEHCRWAARREVVLGALRSMPDFSTVLAWRVGSYMIGLSTLLRRFLPSDTYRIRKKGVRVSAAHVLRGKGRPPPRARLRLSGLTLTSVGVARDTGGHQARTRAAGDLIVRLAVAPSTQFL
jgi:ankyrin repeat protein